MFLISSELQVAKAAGLQLYLSKIKQYPTTWPLSAFSLYISSQRP